jgi:hypothetical protein
VRLPLTTVLLAALAGGSVAQSMKMEPLPNRFAETSV